MRHLVRFGRQHTAADRARTTGLMALALVLALGSGVAWAAYITVGPRGDGTGVIPNGWTVTPAGRQTALGDRPYGMTLSPNGRTLLVSNNGQSTQSLMVVDRASGIVRQTLPYTSPESLYIGVAFSPDGTQAYASAGGNNKIRVYNVNDQQLAETGSIPLTQPGSRANPYPAGLAVSGDGRTLYAANNLSDTLAIIDTTQRTVRATVPVGRNPYSVLLARDGTSAYVSNWGEASVSVVNTANNRVRATIQVGTHPSALALNPRRNELYVANSDSDNVSVIDTAALRVVRTINLAPYQGAREGSSPNALAVAPNGNTLYVANAGNNDVAVVQLGRQLFRNSAQTTPQNGAQGALSADPDADQAVPDAANPNLLRIPERVTGMIPTAWYPTGLAIAPDGNELYVANAKGLGAGPNPRGPNPYVPTTPPNQYVGSMIVGSLSTVPVPNRQQLAGYTQQVVSNNNFDERDNVRGTSPTTPRVIPRRVGDPSPIKHVIYVVKENRTFDQVFGSLGRGNGDPSLNLFDDASAPNQRQLARQFVTLDNFYADAEVSADGWNWSTAAYANTYVQKNWPANYSGRNRPYEFEGGNLATAPSRNPTDAYLWDRLGDAKVSYRNYGFWVFSGKVAPTEPTLAANTDLAFPGYDLTIRDQTRANEWLKELNGYVTRGDLPTVQFLRLPNDHTSGTRPGAPTPKAMVADNDLALGRVVDAVSHSPYWNSTAIFVVEDDAQNGPDHVDAHRTVAQVISPYTQLGKVDSTLYSTVSMLRTMELIVGLSPLTQFDASATPLLNSFSDKPNPQPYKVITPAQSLDERNAANAPLAAESQQMDLTVEDRAPEQVLNEAIWQSVKGADIPMPAPQNNMGAAPTTKDDDD